MGLIIIVMILRPEQSCLVKSLLYEVQHCWPAHSINIFGTIFLVVCIFKPVSLSTVANMCGIKTKHLCESYSCVGGTFFQV